MTEQPAAMAGAILREGRAAGKFQAVKAPTISNGFFGDSRRPFGTRAFYYTAIYAPRLFCIPTELVD